MGKLIVFNNVSLDGYFVDAGGDMRWAHAGGDDAEFRAFTAGNARGEGLLLFGRLTYELMARYWPTPQAAQQMPVVAERMNRATKVVFSRTLQEAAWQNTRLIPGDLVAEVRKLKQGHDVTILGSGSLVAQLAGERLIDEYQLVLNPVVLGGGRTLFEGLKEKLPLKLARTRTFGNGKTWLCYEA